MIALQSYSISYHYYILIFNQSISIMLVTSNREDNQQPGYSHIARQVYAVFYKNFSNHMSNKKKLLGEMILPIIISVIYGIDENMKTKEPLIGLLLDMLLKIYIGLIGISALRELITIFITERLDNFRQYQMIFGMSHRTHTLSNLLYMFVYLSCFLLPFYLTINYFHFKLIYVFYFASFVISSSVLTLAFTAFFKDHKIALEIIGMFFSLSAFLPFLYDDSTETYNWTEYLAMIIPNSSFTIAILYEDTEAALLSLFFVKIYFLIYSIVQFPEYYVELFSSCCKQLNKIIPILNSQPNHLMEQFQLNEVINSELENNQMFHQHKRVVIRTDNLIKTYEVNGSKVNALNGVNLKIHKSEIFGLLGRNGAGKTTLVDILTSVTTPTLGSFQIVNNKQTIGICYQHEILYQHLTVQQHLYFYSLVKPYCLREEQTRQTHIDNIITTLNIDSERKKQVKQLSGGNKRKLSIAIAIIGRPEILIFDEPTSGLDPLSRIYVWEILQKLREMESTIILTTHHLDEAEKLSDWICVIEKGNVIVENTAEKIKQKYGRGYHLTITFTDLDSESIKYSDIEKFKTLIESLKLKGLQLEHVDKEINFLIKPFNKETSIVEFEDRFISLVEQLEKHKHLQLHFHSNTLEQSFIAIIRDSDNNSGDSLGEQISSARQNHQFDPYPSAVRHFYQLIGVILKNAYYQKSVFLQAIIIYNINILIVLISFFFNQLVTKFIVQNSNSETELAPKQGAAQKNVTILLQGYIIMATAFISSPVYEKQKKIRAVLNTRGLNGFSYWLGNFLFDFSVYNINLIIMMKFVAPELIAIVKWSTLFELGIAVILYAYCFSFLFEKVKSASTWFSVINMIFGIIIMPMILFGQNTFFHYLDFLKYLYPFYDLTVAVFFQFQNESMAALSELANIKKPEGSTIFINIAFYFLLLMALEYKVVARIKYPCRGQQEPEQSLQTIKMENIYKKFGKIEALKDVSWEANEERLALLGHNGAGKSTTFGLLSAQLNQDAGYLYIEKRHHKPYENTLSSSGICYQDDSLWQQMLVDEILKIFSFIVPIRKANAQIKWLFQSLQYDPNNIYKRFSNLSGGNKRKLCMMIALYGDPLMRLLDECSTGLDPSSRLAMVQTIKASKRGTTIFTTHSMSEAEDLCTKAVIMSKGAVIEFDYISRLKSKYFNCCWVDVRLNIDQDDPEAKTPQIFTKSLDREGIVIETRDKSQIRLEINKKQIRMSEILRVLQKLKAHGVVSNYSNVQPRLQDVYIKVTREDGEMGEDQQSNIQSVDNASAH